MTRRKWWIMKVEICVKFNTGKIVHNCVVLEEVIFKSPKLKWFEYLELLAFPSIMSERRKEHS